MRVSGPRFSSLLLTAALAALATSGCFALDELDSATAMLDNKAPAKAEAQEEEVAGTPAKPRLKWDNVHTIHAGELDDSIVRCSLHGSVQFMRVEDCRARGGRPGKV